MTGKHLLFGYNEGAGGYMNTTAQHNRGDFGGNIYYSVNPTEETTRYKSVIFPLEVAEFKSSLTQYLEEYGDVDTDSVYKKLDSMTKANSEIKWTSDPIRKYTTSDYCTCLCSVYGDMQDIDKERRIKTHRLTIYRKLVTTAFKETHLMSKKNMVLCEEIIIQLMEAGGSMEAKKTDFRNTKTCLILTARATAKPTMHFQGLSAFTVVPKKDEETQAGGLPVYHERKSRVIDSMQSAGWLLSRVNNATNTKNVGQAIEFFSDILTHESVQSTSLELNKGRLKQRGVQDGDWVDHKAAEDEINASYKRYN